VFEFQNLGKAVARACHKCELEPEQQLGLAFELRHSPRLLLLWKEFICLLAAGGCIDAIADFAGARPSPEEAGWDAEDQLL